MFGDILVVTTWRSASGICQAEDGDAAKQTRICLEQLP